MTNELKEKYANKYGWIQVNGYRIDLERAGEYDFEYLYVEKDNELVKEMSFWKDKDDNDKNCFDDVNEVISYIEDAYQDVDEYMSFKEFQNKQFHKRE